MIQFQCKINPINLIYMKKEYGNIYNKNIILNFSYFKFKKIFAQEDSNLVKQYNIYVINQYIKENYKYTNKFLSKLKRILRKTKVKLLDLDEQEMQLLEERIFSTERHIKILPTNFPLEKGEKVGIKFIHAKIYRKTNNRLKLIEQGDLLISNYRIIFIVSRNELIFYWYDMENIDYSQQGFEFFHGAKKFVISIHDSEALNNTMKNFMSKTNNNVNSKYLRNSKIIILN